jgi:uncharacterized protein (TIGR01370 family)
MKYDIVKLKWIIFLGTSIIFSFFSPSCSEGNFRSAAFYYASNPPVNELRAFDLAIVDPDHDFDPMIYRTKFSEAIAYVSVGEADPSRDYSKRILADWLIGDNQAWGTHVLDQSNPDWQSFFVSEVIEPLWQKGYRGFFLDTLDSYRLAASRDRWDQQVNGIISIIRAIKQKHPDAKLILNRGFEMLPRARELVYAVAAESLFQQWIQTDGKYEAVPEGNRTWLLSELNKVKSLGIAVIVIDYVPPGKRQLAQETAGKIKELGFIPWVADHDLETLGVGTVEVMPRRILGLYDGTEASDVTYTNIQRYGAMPLNYLGYVLELHDVRKPLPIRSLSGTYAGILVWVNSDSSGISQKLNQWLARQIDDGMRVVFFEYFGFPESQESFRRFKIEYTPLQGGISKSSIVQKDPVMGYEIEPMPRMDTFIPIRVKDNKALLQVRNESGMLSDAAAYTEWGGYVLYPFTVMQLPDGQVRWVINPFDFLKTALRLPEMPVPDTTTENGRRLMMVHVDGDGFVERARWGERKFAGEVAYQEIFSRYQVPMSISIIQGEIARNGLYGNLSNQLEPIARKIFYLPWVEIASHTHSHPFVWTMVGETGGEGNSYHLNIPGYRFNLETEIAGSVDYINRTLAPPGKRCRMLFWTGNCVPSEEAITLTERLGLGNLNGGETTITESQKSVTNVAPLGVYKGSHYQIFAPNQNENVYTNRWTGPFDGYQRVIETFRLTDTPRRLKPIDMYFHFYSASRKASLDALHKVFAWALRQRVFNIYASEYAERVVDFNRTVVARDGDSWLVRNSGILREFRISENLGVPDMMSSSNIAGFSDYEKNRYIHMGPEGEARFRLVDTPISVPYVVDANAALTDIERTGGNLTYAFEGHTPLSLTFGSVKGFSIRCGNTKLEPSAVASGVLTLNLKQTKEVLVFQKKSP